jgi:hypothetical protein
MQLPAAPAGAEECSRGRESPVIGRASVTRAAKRRQRAIALSPLRGLGKSLRLRALATAIREYAAKTPAGVAAISRRLIAATPPVRDAMIERAEPGGFAAIERCDPVGVDEPAGFFIRWYRR